MPRSGRKEPEEKLSPGTPAVPSTPSASSSGSSGSSLDVPRSSGAEFGLDPDCHLTDVGGGAGAPHRSRPKARRFPGFYRLGRVAEVLSRAGRTDLLDLVSGVPEKFGRKARGG